MLSEIDNYIARLLLIKNLTEKREDFHHRSTLYAIVTDEINQLMEMCTEDMQTMYTDKQ